MVTLSKLEVFKKYVRRARINVSKLNDKDAMDLFYPERTPQI